MCQKSNCIPAPSFLEIERQARIERGIVMRDCVHGTARGFSIWVSTVVQSSRLLRRFAAARLRRRAIRELHQLGDRALADLGLSRGEIESLVRYGRPAHMRRCLPGDECGGTPAKRLAV